MHFKKLFAGICALLLTTGLMAQQYERTYNIQNLDVSFPYFIQNSQVISANEILTVGTVLDDGTGDKAIFVVKTDLAGNIIWSRTYSHGVFDQMEGLTLWGNGTSAVILGVNNNQNVIAIRINVANGGVIWSQSYSLGLTATVARVLPAVVGVTNAYAIVGTTEVSSGLTKPYMLAVQIANGNMLFGFFYDDQSGQNPTLSGSVSDLSISGFSARVTGSLDERIAQFEVDMNTGLPLTGFMSTFGPSGGLGLLGKIDISPLVDETDSYFCTGMEDPMNPGVFNKLYVRKAGIGGWDRTYALAGIENYDALAIYRNNTVIPEEVFLFARAKDQGPEHVYYMLKLDQANGDVTQAHTYSTIGLGGSMTQNSVTKEYFWNAYDENEDDHFYLSHTDDKGTTTCEISVEFTAGEVDGYSEVLEDLQETAIGIGVPFEVVASGPSVVFDENCAATSGGNKTSEVSELVEDATDFSVYPNPVDRETETLTIQLGQALEGNAHITIYDAVGRLVHQAQQPVQGLDMLEVDASPLTTGVNFVHITVGEATFMQRVVKQ